MKKLLFILAIVLSVIFVYYNYISKQTLTKERINYAISYCKSNNIKAKYIIFVNFSIHSGKNRLFVYDIKNNKIILKSLCAHGNGLNSTNSTPIFSNVPGSHCSSLGFFKLGDFNYMSNNVPSYILHGLSSTNYNARIRQILIHPYYSVSPVPIYPFYTDMNISNGCFVIDTITFNKIVDIANKNNNIILYSYIEN